MILCQCLLVVIMDAKLCAYVSGSEYNEIGCVPSTSNADVAVTNSRRGSRCKLVCDSDASAMDSRGVSKEKHVCTSSTELDGASKLSAQENEYSVIRDSFFRKQKDDKSKTNIPEYSKVIPRSERQSKPQEEQHIEENGPVYTKPIPKSERNTATASLTFDTKKGSHEEKMTHACSFNVVFPDIDCGRVTATLPHDTSKGKGETAGPTYCNLVSRQTKSIRKV